MLDISRHRRNRAEWPEHPPTDFHLRMLDVLSYRSCSASDIWDEVREWLAQHQVPVPADVLALDGMDSVTTPDLPQPVAPAGRRRRPW